MQNSTRSESPIQLRSLGSFHIGGSIARLEDRPQLELTPVPGSPSIRIDPNGSFPFGQMYVQYARLESPRSPWPIFLWHGGGLTGACWESTPDGRAGWQSFFLRSGLDVYACDAVERGRASWSRYPDIYPSEPFFMPQHAAWELYRVGRPDGFSDDPALRSGFPGGLFPVHDFDAFTRQIVPRWSSNDALIQAAYGELLLREGPCILLAHSQGGGFALRAALAHPEMVKALVLVEPGGAPDLTPSDIASLVGIPTSTVWGDNVQAVPFWAAARAKSDAIMESILRHGGKAHTMDLPAMGIRGNSHLPMMDENSDEVAGHIRDWLRQNGLLD